MTATNHDNDGHKPRPQTMTMTATNHDHDGHSKVVYQDYVHYHAIALTRVRGPLSWGTWCKLAQLQNFLINILSLH